MNDDIDRNRRRALKVTAGVGAFGFVGLSAARGDTDDDTVRFSGHDHEARGNASLEASDSSLAVAGLENEGEDGVRTHLEGAGTSTTTHDSISLWNPGDALTISMRGAYDGTPDAPVGQFALTNEGDRIDVDMDTGDVNASAFRVGVYVDGVRVGYIKVAHRNWHFGYGCFRHGGWGAHRTNGGNNPGFGVDFEEQVAFMTEDGRKLEGDAYTFEAIETDQPVEGLSSVETRANVDSLTFRDVKSR